MPGIRPLLVLGIVALCLFALVGGAAASNGQTGPIDELLPVAVGEQGPAALREAEFHDAGEERTFGDAAGDRLELTFDGALDAHALGRDGDPQVVVSGAGGDDRTLQAGEHVDFRVEGDTLTIEVTGAGGDEVADIRYRWVTIVDEVYDTNNSQVAVPDEGVQVGEWDPDAEPAQLQDAEFRPEGDEDVYGDAKGDTLALTFDRELDEHRLGHAGDPQVTVSTLGGDDLTLTDDEGVRYDVEGHQLEVTVDDPENRGEIDDIRNRKVTIVDEVYDTNNNQVTVPDAGVWLDEEPGELQSVTFTDAGQERTFGDTEGDTLALDFDTELDRVAANADGQVIVSGEGGDDMTLQQSEALDFSVEGTELTLTVTEPDGVTEVADIRYRKATNVDEVYDVNDFEVVVPEDGVPVDESG